MEKEKVLKKLEELKVTFKADFGQELPQKMLNEVLLAELEERQRKLIKNRLTLAVLDQDFRDIFNHVSDAQKSAKKSKAE